MFKIYLLILIALLLQSCNALEKLAESGQNVGSCSGNTLLISNATRSGELQQSERWSGNITISGDILIGNNCTLTIDPGTTITFTANSDSTEHGFNSPITDSHFPNDPATKPSEFSGIELWGGQLNAVGTTENPIIFTSDAESKVAGDWHSITLRKEGSYLTLKHTTIEYAYYGIQFNERTDNNYVEVSQNTIREIVACGICFGIELNKPVTLTISDNNISSCGHEGIDLHGNATAIIERNTFSDIRGKFVSEPHEIGGNGIAVDKSNNSIIRHNTFLRNNQGIACVTDNSSPSIEDNNIFGTDDDKNDENIQNCPR